MVFSVTYFSSLGGLVLYQIIGTRNITIIKQMITARVVNIPHFGPIVNFFAVKTSAAIFVTELIKEMWLFLLFLWAASVLFCNGDGLFETCKWFSCGSLFSAHSDVIFSVWEMISPSSLNLIVSLAEVALLWLISIMLYAIKTYTKKYHCWVELTIPVIGCIPVVST